MSEITEERTLIAILQTRVMSLDADKAALEAENAKMKEAASFARVMIDHFVHGEEDLDALTEAHTKLRIALGIIIPPP